MSKAKKKTKVTIVDADSVAYRCAAASEKRSILVVHNPTGIEKEFNTRTEFKDLLKSKNKLSKLDEYSIKDVQTPENLENCLHSVKMNIERIKERTEAEQMVIIVGGKSNYREQLPLPSLYKGARADTIRPLHLKEAKQYLLNKYSAEEINGIEADDEVIIRAYEFKDMGFDTTIASIDKDCFQVEGFRLYNYADDELFDIEGCAAKNITKGKGTKVVGSGVGFLAFQLVFGDRVDGYCPYELAGVRYGEASALKDFKGCKEPKDFLEVVVAKYKEWYPEPVTYTAWDGTEHTKNWNEILDMYFKSAYMLRSRYDKASAEEFFDMYEVKL